MSRAQRLYIARFKCAATLSILQHRPRLFGDPENCLAEITTRTALHHVHGWLRYHIVDRIEPARQRLALFGAVLGAVLGLVDAVLLYHIPGAGSEFRSRSLLSVAIIDDCRQRPGLCNRASSASGRTQFWPCVRSVLV